MAKFDRVCACDFETTTNIEDCRVWAWGAIDLSTNKFTYGNSIESFFEFAVKQKKIYFHNLAFDGEFILNYLFQIMPYDDALLLDTCFSCVITDRGQWYSITIKYFRKQIRIWDSFKLIPLSIEKISSAFNLSVKKLELDYRGEREKGHILTEHELAYLKNDVIIMAEGLKYMLNAGLTKMTIGANALAEYKKIVGKSRFTHTFPPPYKYDSDIRGAYRGGYSYVNPIFQNVDIASGIVLDVNSLYPYIMHERILPYGEGVFFEGEYKFDPEYPLYILKLACSFEIKPNKLPTIQIKNSFIFNQHEYLSSSNGEIVVLNLTNIDFELMKDHYFIEDLHIYGGWKFKARSGMFKDYIDKWFAEKKRAELEGNAGLRLEAKLFLNNLYGKYATNPERARKIPYVDENNEIKFKPPIKENSKCVYLPVGIFVTSWARDYTIRAAQANYSRFCYADTDSLHLIGTEPPQNLRIHNADLGAWKIEKHFKRARFVKQKTYIEETEKGLEITCAGMPSRCYQYVTFDNFKKGNKFQGKLRRKRCKGGVVLLDSTHEIK